MSKPHTERWAYRFLYTKGIFALTTRLYPVLGRRIFYLVSRSVAGIYAWTQPGVREVVRKNLGLLTGKKHRASEAAKVFDYFARTIADYVAVGAMSARKVDALVEAQEGITYLEEATRGGKGVILATGHYSFFELGSVALKRAGYKVCIATLPEPTSELTAWRRNWRKRWGTTTVEVGSDPFSSFSFIQALQDGYCTAMLVDRPYGARNQVIQMPGGQLYFSSSPALFSWMTGCAILPVIIRRTETGRYRLIVKPPLYARKGMEKDRNLAVARCTELLAEALFEEMQKAPQQWYQFVPVEI